jgi:hypothetical protein
MGCSRTGPTGTAPVSGGLWDRKGIGNFLGVEYRSKPLALAMGYLTYAQGEAQVFEPGQTIDRRQASGSERIRVEISL